MIVTQINVKHEASGRYEFATRTGRWEYDYDVSALGTRSETRTGRLGFSGKEVVGKPLVHVATPWGLMQRFEGQYERGWLLERTLGNPIDPTVGGDLEPPADLLEADGEWNAELELWGYRLNTIAMGSKSETRSGRTFYSRSVVVAQEEGSRVSTPWGVAYWLGKPHESSTIVPGDYEAGWLFRGTHERPLAYEGPWITPVRVTARAEMVFLESAYLADSKLGHRVALWVPIKSAASCRTLLLIDPNACQLNEYGDRTSCTRMAVRQFDIELTRLRLGDPLHLGRSIYQVRGADLPAPMALIADAHFERFHLKTDREVIPLLETPAQGT